MLIDFVSILQPSFQKGLISNKYMKKIFFPLLSDMQKIQMYWYIFKFLCHWHILPFCFQLLSLLFLWFFCNTIILEIWRQTTFKKIQSQESNRLSDKETNDSFSSSCPADYFSSALLTIVPSICALFCCIFLQLF